MKFKILMSVVVCGLVLSLCAAPVSATIIDDFFNFVTGTPVIMTDPTQIDATIDSIIASSTSVDDAVNKIVTNNALNSTAKTYAQTVVFGYNESVMNPVLNETFDDLMMNETMEVSPESILLAEEARLAAEEASRAYDEYITTFVEHYKPTGKFGDPIN